jgi:hypothetical protein
MFDEHARRLIERLPRLPDLDHVTCRRTLSSAYLLIVDARIRTDARDELATETFELRQSLRRMANALESVAVFDPLNGIAVDDATREASAFVAGEALTLMEELASPLDLPSRDPILDPHTYGLVEGALLFLIGGYDINAVAAVARTHIPPVIDGASAEAMRQRSGGRLLRRILALCRGNVAPLGDGEPPAGSDQPALLDALADEVRMRLYEELCTALETYLGWLREDGDLAAAVTQIERVRDACRTGSRPSATGLPSASVFSDVYHLASLLAAAIRATSARSVVHRVPPPNMGDPTILSEFPAYLRTRAAGTPRLRGRPLLWPSTLEYIHDCLPGPHRDAVVSMPTGSGKSFLAELAVAHALSRGWVLYLAPTNALAHQIRRDLGRALEPFTQVHVSAFVGGAEYTALSDEELDTGLFVGVMTPEKCALALRLYQETFAKCALCVFDEAHLLKDPNRGAVADILIAQLFRAAPDMRVLLMSAMVSNAEELASWLSSVRGTEASVSKVKWRPSRAARGFVFVDQPSLESVTKNARSILATTTGAKTVKATLPLGWIAGLSGPWTRDGAVDYRTAKLPLEAEFALKRNKKGKVSGAFTSWKNRTGLATAELFALHGLPAINFVLSSRHHAFGAAERVDAELPGAIGAGTFPELVEAQLAIADAELGVETRLRHLLRKGVATHTAAMLQVEQAAAEWMFAEGKAKLMIATGTLAQGLNLPAVAVVVSGSKLAAAGSQDLRELDAAAGLTRANELILNGFGRAGRPGFANQGVVVLVSDDPLQAPIVRELDGARPLADYPVLGEPDASVAIVSPIETFLDDLLAMGAEGDATKLEVALTSLLSAFEDADENAGTILRRTFAGYRMRERFTAEHAALAQARVAEVKSRFLDGADVPAWMPGVAMKAGVDFLRAQRMWQAYEARGRVSLDALAALDVRGWFDVLVDVLSHMPVARVVDYLDQKATPTPRTKLASLAAHVRDRDVVPWARPDGWVDAWRELGAVVIAYMEGKPFTEVGARLFGIPASDFTAQRSDGARGLPPVFKFVGDVVERALSIDAGCFLAMHESWLEAEHPGTPVPEYLQALPLCVRNGCDNLDVLGWFRFGFRQRTCAHALAETFPLANGLVGDAARSEAVRDARRRWLRQEAQGERSLLDFARVVVREGSSERS